MLDIMYKKVLIKKALNIINIEVFLLLFTYSRVIYLGISTRKPLEEKEFRFADLGLSKG